MAIVRPFKGVRYNLEKVLLKQVTAPPYDVISPEFKEELKERCPYNVVKLDLPDGEEDKYKNAGKLYEEWLHDKVLVKDDKPGFYVYEQIYTYEGREYVRTGFVGLLKLEELGKGAVYPHEKTLSGPKKDRFELMKSTETNLSQIFGLYMDKESKMNAFFNDTKKVMPIASAVDDEGVKNTIWYVNDPELIEEVETFMKDKAIYIADGHHRYETALNYKKHMREQNKDVDDETKPYDFVMMMFVNFYDEGLKIFPTHRVVEVPEDYNFDGFLKDLGKTYDIEKLDDEAAGEKFLAEANSPRACVVYHKDAFYGVKMEDEVFENLHTTYRTVDTYVLQKGILIDTMGIDEDRILRKDGIYFVQSMDVIKKHEARTNVVTFMLKGCDIEAVRNISESGLVMPQKSTYFYPKLTTGLVINEL